MPEADSNQLRVTMEMTDEDADEAQIRNMADQVMERIQSVDHVETVGTIIGDSESLMTGMGDSDRSAVSIYVVLDEEKGNSRDAEKEIEEACADLEGCEVTADGSSVDMSALGGSGISVQISGQEDPISCLPSQRMWQPLWKEETRRRTARSHRRNHRSDAGALYPSGQGESHERGTDRRPGISGIEGKTGAKRQCHNHHFR